MLYRKKFKKARFLKILILHLTGFEPVMSQWKTDYESVAFDHSATNAKHTLFYSKHEGSRTLDF